VAEKSLQKDTADQSFLTRFFFQAEPEPAPPLTWGTAFFWTESQPDPRIAASSISSGFDCWSISGVK
jgi:hypothetical protein